MRRVSDDPGLGERFRAAECVFFDCDGVVFDSNGFKVDAMRHALAGEPKEALERMLVYWRQNGGVSRWVKFRHYFEHIAPSADIDRDVERACERFGAYSLRAYDAYDAVPQALDAARRAGKERCFIVSGASQLELETVFAKKGIASLYAAVLGSPRPKRELVQGVLTEREASAGRCLFIGDGAGDFRVASELGVPFVYLDQFTEWTGALETLRDAPSVTWADDWDELARAFAV